LRTWPRWRKEYEIVDATLMSCSFEILADDPSSSARRGRLLTPHGTVDTPVFMPVGTQATVKGVTPRDLREQGVQILLSNTYHLAIRPGIEVVGRAGGLHSFMGWDRPILTDSGGYQVFSLAKLRTVRADGVEFNNHFDGARLFLGPVEAMSIQRVLGSDIAMVIDECPPYPCEYVYACQAVDKTLAWAASCLEQDRAPGCANELTAMGFDGYAIGGVSVGEPEAVLMGGVEHSVPFLPADRPRYLMGVGKMHQILEAVARGVDMFDCVIPTRFARNGTAFTRRGAYPVKAGEYKSDARPVEEGCGCYACANFSRAYIRHLLNVKEILGVHLLTLHNLYRYMQFMCEIREALEAGCFAELRREYGQREGVT